VSLKVSMLMDPFFRCPAGAVVDFVSDGPCPPNFTYRVRPTLHRVSSPFPKFFLHTLPGFCPTFFPFGRFVSRSLSHFDGHRFFFFSEKFFSINCRKILLDTFSVSVFRT